MTNIKSTVLRHLRETDTNQSIIDQIEKMMDSERVKISKILLENELAEIFANVFPPQEVVTLWEKWVTRDFFRNVGTLGDNDTRELNRRIYEIAMRHERLLTIIIETLIKRRLSLHPDSTESDELNSVEKIMQKSTTLESQFLRYITNTKYNTE